MGHDSHHEKVNAHAVPEADSELPLRARSLELIKHNPNLFHVDIFDACKLWTIVGGWNTLACEFVGGAFGYWYYAQRTRLNPATFYTGIALSFSRMFLGAAIGGAVGFLKFGDRQRVHNAWVAERLRRRYPDTLNLDVHDLYRFKGVKANHHFYKWV